MLRWRRLRHLQGQLLPLQQRAGLPAHVCNSKLVYPKGGSDGLVLYMYQPTGYSDWVVSTSDHATSCDEKGFNAIASGGVCPDSPDGGGCAGKWMEYAVGPNPSLVVDATRPCVGSPCGPHSTSCVADSTANCNRNANFVLDFPLKMQR